MTYSHNNTVTFDFGNGLLKPRTNNISKFNFYITKPYKVLDFKQECYKTAQLLSQKAKTLNKVPVILLSGGLDSEVVCKSFIDQGIDFIPLTFKFNDDLNSHELYYVNKFSKRHNLDTIYFNLNIFELLNSNVSKQIWESSYCSYFINLCHIYTIKYANEILNGVPIVGEGDPLIINNNGVWNFTILEYPLALYWYMQKNNIEGSAAFYHYTNTLLYSILLEPYISNAASGANIIANKTIKNSTVLKYYVYKKYWVDLELRQKYSGSEQIREYIRPIEIDWAKISHPIAYTDTWSKPYLDIIKELEV